MNKCFCCHKNTEGEQYHLRCLRKLFGHKWVPEIPYALSDMPDAVSKEGGRMSISGVQIKASCRVITSSQKIKIVSVQGTHILKPQPAEYPGLPQCENLCMNIAAGLGMRVPPHGLFQMKDNTPCYIIARFDRGPRGTKHQVEDMAQILSYHSDDKYNASMEKIGKAIWKFTSNPGLEVLDFFERVLLSHIIGNGDMHLKNWSIMREESNLIRLTPCYDFIASSIYISSEEETALTINGKKNKLSRSDFEIFANYLEIEPKSREMTFRKFIQARESIIEMINNSEMIPEYRDKLRGLVENRFTRLNLARS